MAKVILGKKLGMTQIFTEEGKVVPVTVVESGKNVVLQSKTVETDGYNAVQIGFGTVKEKNVTKPMKGHFAKAGVEPVKFIRELRLADVPEYKAGDSISVDIFGAGDLVDVTGTSKGKGFAGGIKRHNFARGPMGHGSKSHREPGSTGAMISGHGGRVLKGKKLPGRMGGAKVTVQRLSVVRVDADRNLILIKGAIPGAKNSFVVIKDTVAGQQIGDIELNESVFGVEVNEGLVHQAVVMQLAAQRLGTHATKTRGLVRGGGRKPWKQKGTGRARSGSTRSPLWVGGGTVFGPSPRSYAFRMPRKQRRLAIKCALTDKVNNGDFIVLESLDFAAPKTKEVVKMMSDFNVAEKALIVTADVVENVEKSSRNIPGVKAISSCGLNVYDILNHNKLFITKDAITRIEEVLA